MLSDNFSIFLLIIEVSKITIEREREGERENSRRLKIMN